jgi:hypothetical protein
MFKRIFITKRKYSKNDLLDKLYEKISEKNILEIQKNKELEEKLIKTHQGEHLVKVGGKGGFGGQDLASTTYIGSIIEPVEINLEKLKNDKNFDFEYFMEKKKAIEKFYYIPEHILKEDEKLSFWEKIFFWVFSIGMGYLIGLTIYKYQTSKDIMLQRSSVDIIFNELGHEMNENISKLKSEKLWNEIVSERFKN